MIEAATLYKVINAVKIGVDISQDAFNLISKVAEGNEITPEEIEELVANRKDIDSKMGEAFDE